MSDNLPTTWPISAHTKAKHAILERYLKAWFPILSRQAAKLQQQFGGNASRRVLYVDGFAGPGIYDAGEPGSPVIATRTAIEHSHEFPFPIEMIFIEQREDRHRRLCELLRADQENARRVSNVHPMPPRYGDCDEVLTKMLDEDEKAGIRFGPALAFLDQFGYGAVSMKLIGRILAIPSCEVFTYLDYKDMNRWIVDPDKSPAFDRAFGGDEWRQCIALPESERRAELLRHYKNALRTRGNAKYVTAFSMFDQNRMPLYWLIFCTNNLRGLEEMKEAMWFVDKTGEFRFSDRDAAAQLSLLEGFSQDWLAGELREKLARKTLSVANVKEYVLTDTPCYLFKSALKQLECSQKVVTVARAPAGRKPGTYPDEMLEEITLKFSPCLFAS